MFLPLDAAAAVPTSDLSSWDVDRWTWEEHGEAPRVSRDGKWLLGQSGAQVCIASIDSPGQCLPFAEGIGGTWLDDQRVVVRRETGWLVVDRTTGTAGPFVDAGRERVIVPWAGRVIGIGDSDVTAWTADGAVEQVTPTRRLWSRFWKADAPNPVIGLVARRATGFGRLIDLGTGRGIATVDRESEPWRGTWTFASNVLWDDKILAIDGLHYPTDTLVAIDRSGAATPVHAPSRGGVTAVLQDRRGVPVAVAERWGRTRWVTLAGALPELSADLQRLQSLLPEADFDLTNVHADDPVWLVSAISGKHPSFFYLYRRDTGGLVRVPPHHGASEEVAWRPMDVVTHRAPDGGEYPSYLTKPDPEVWGPPPYPAVVEIHGGPRSQGNWYGFNPIAQMRALQGVASVAVDFRGSWGYGRAFGLSNDNAGMAADISRAMDDLVASGDIDPARLAITGASYGGYSTLVALTAEPDRYRCGVSVAGSPRMWFFDTAALRPSRHVERLKAPLLGVQGLADRTVTPGPVRAFYRRAARLGLPATLIELPGRDHETIGMVDSFAFDVSNRFLMECLGRESGFPVHSAASDYRIAVEGTPVPWLHRP